MADSVPGQLEASQSGANAGASGEARRIGDMYTVGQINEKLTVSAKSSGELVADFEWPACPGAGTMAEGTLGQHLAWSDWLDERTLVVLFSRQLRCYDVSGKALLFDTLLDSYFETGVILRDRRAVVVGTGEQLEAWDLSDVNGLGGVRLPLEYIHDESFQPMEGVEHGYSILPGGRLVDLEVRGGKPCFVVWSVRNQCVLETTPFPFPKGFEPTYCNKVANGEVLMIGDYGESHYLFNLKDKQWESIGDASDPEELPDTEENVELSYFWKLADLGGGCFATLPKEGYPAVAHVWDVATGCRIANFQIGVESAESIQREAEDIVKVTTPSETQLWRISSSDRLVQ